MTTSKVKKEEEEDGKRIEEDKARSFSGKPVIDQAIAGLTAGGIATLTLHPIDLIKTKMQEKIELMLLLYNLADGGKKSERQKLLGRVKGSFQSIIRKEGYLGLYRGLSPNLIGSSVSWACYFGWYSAIKSTYSKELGDGRASDKMTSSQYMLASAEAGALTIICTNPILVVKTRIFTTPTGSPNAYNGLTDGIIKILREEGLRGLFRGLVPALFGASHSALQFMAYEKLKNWRTAKNPVSSKPSDKLPTLDYVWMASISKVFATILTYPYQVVKTRQQISPNQTENQYRGVLDTIKKVHSREGLSGFYKGLLPSTLRVIPNTAVTFLIYESISYYFRSNSP